MARRKPKRAAIYCRQSEDRDDDRLGVERQEKSCRELADDLGWSVVEVFVDNDFSATKGKPRPAYDRMCQAIEAGEIDGVLVVEAERLVRLTRELEPFIDLANNHNVALANLSGDFNLSTAEGRAAARNRAVWASYEGEKKAERQRRRYDQDAEKGLPHAGPRPFGFEPDRITHRPAEADLLCDAARRVLAGESMRSIVSEWNAAGTRTARGNEWSVNSLRVVLTSPRIAGLRQLRGEVAGEAAWEPIIDRETWERLRSVVKARRRPGRPPTSLLTGILVCGRCGHRLTIARLHGDRYYKCRRVPGEQTGCQRLSIKADPVDEWVTEAMLHRLASGGLQRAMDDATGRRNDSLVSELEADEHALDQLAHDHYVDRVIDRSQFLAAQATLRDRISRARRELAANAEHDVLAELPADADRLRALWVAAVIDRRRAIVSAVLEGIEVRPHDGGPRRFDPDRLEPRWRV